VQTMLRVDLVALNTFNGFNLLPPRPTMSFAKPICVLLTADKKAVAWCSRFLHSDKQDEFRENQCRGSKL